MRHTVEINRDGIIIDGNPKILLCSSLFYFRIPRECWQDRMEKLKLCGYNCIDVYFPWNYHELAPGVWDFSGQHDVDAFLGLASEMGLYVIARPGPYICSEWDGGGLPAFLDNDGLRTNSATYLEQLNRWMDRILPIIARHQLTVGGSVVMLQLENELDYFGSGNPKEYMEYLAQTAKRHGIDVPLTACAGQWDTEKATGYAQDIIVTFNVYMDENEPLFEDRCIKMQKKLYENGLPFLIMETHRPHSLLKRELCCGARLISPYNQMAGVNYDLYNGLTNWSDEKDHFPLSYIATDYDFPSTMISAEGELRDKALEARLFSNLINTFPSLAQGQPAMMENVSVSAEFPTSRTVDEDGRNADVVFGYDFDDGFLINLANLSHKSGSAELNIGGDLLKTCLSPRETKLLPYNISLKNFGINAKLLWSEAEIAWIRAGAKAEDGSDDVSCEVLLYSREASSCCLVTESDVIIESAGDAVFENIRDDVSSCQAADIHVAQDGKLTIRGLDCVALLTVNGKRLKIMICSPEKAARMESPWLKALAEPDVPVIRNLTVLGTGDIAPAQPMEDRLLTNLEKHGVYRGAGVYELDIKKNEKLLLHNVADIIYTYHDGKTVDIAHKSGTSYFLDASPGKWTFVVESWGHSNFNDIRLPSLRMGSLKGIKAVTSIIREDDITDMYYVQTDKFPFEDTCCPQFEHLEDTCPSSVDHSSGKEADCCPDNASPGCSCEDKKDGHLTAELPVFLSVNEIIRPEAPLCLAYSRKVFPPEGCNRFVLHFNGNTVYIAIYIDGRFCGTVDPADPFVDISDMVVAGRPFTLTLRIMKSNCFQPVGRISLLGGISVETCRFAPMDISYYVNLSGICVADGGDFPLEVERGSFKLAKLGIPHRSRDARITFDGSDMELFCMLNGHVVGRVLLPTEGFPQVKGGHPFSVMIPAQWGDDEPLTVLMCGIGNRPRLTNVTISF